MPQDTLLPVHLVPGPRGHGVDLYARQLADTVGAEVVGDLGRGDRRPCHLHVTDRLWGDTPEQAARRVVGLCASRPTTLTLHDLPQPQDGVRLHPRRRAAYAAMARAATGIVVSSQHERRLLAQALGGTSEVVVEVVPLPWILPWVAPTVAPRPAAPASAADHASLGLAGWFYPGKGHLPALGAAAAMRRRGLTVDLLVLGQPAPGHAADAAELVRRAARLGVRVEVTGWIEDEDLPDALRAVDVPFAGHRNVSASGSVNSWLAAGRRPLVRRGPYFEEMERFRPGTLGLTDIGSLADAVAAALADPGSTWLDPSLPLRHDLADAGRDYRRFWTRVLAEAAGRVA